MVGVHLLELKFFATDCTFMILLFIGSKSITSVKSTNREFLFFTCQQILVNAGFFRYIFITHKTLNF